MPWLRSCGWGGCCGSYYAAAMIVEATVDTVHAGSICFHLLSRMLSMRYGDCVCLVGDGCCGGSCYNGSWGCSCYTESVELAAVGVDTAGAGLNCFHGYLDYAICGAWLRQLLQLFWRLRRLQRSWGCFGSGCSGLGCGSCCKGFGGCSGYSTSFIWINRWRLSKYTCYCTHQCILP